MKRLLVVLFLLITVPCWGAPSNSMSITPSATSGEVITAADENARNNEISTKFNAHSHTDISQTGNTLSVGDATAGNKTIQANNADTNKPYIRYDDTNNKWTVSQDGTTAQTIVVVTGTTANDYILPQSATAGEFIQFVGLGWQAVDTATPVVAGLISKDQTDATGTTSYTGLGFKPSVIYFSAIQDSSAEWSLGFSDGTTGFSLFNNTNASAGTFRTGNVIETVEGSSDKYEGDVNSMDSDGFTMGWTKTGTPTGSISIYYIAFD